MDEKTFWETLAVNSQQGGSGSLSGSNNSAPTDAFHCHRGRLEALLGKDLSISWDKNLKDLQLASPSKELTVYFDDRSSLKTRCLIGCDGPHSATRRSLSSPMKLQVLPYVVYRGKRFIPCPKYMKTMHKYMQNSLLIQAHKGENLLELSVNDISELHVSLSYTYSRPAKPNNDPLHKPNRPIFGETDIPEEFYEELAALQDLEPPFNLIL